MKPSLKQVYAGIFGLSCCLAACAQDQGNGEEEDLATVTSPLVGHPTTIGVARQEGSSLHWQLRTSNSPGNATIAFNFGSYRPVVGDWNANGVDTIGSFKQVGGNWEWSLRNSNSEGGNDITVVYGSQTLGDFPVVGDWDGNGTVTIGVVRPNGNGNGNWRWMLRNSNTPGNPELDFEHGSVTLNDRPIVGDWDGNSTTTVGVVRNTGNTWRWLLRNSNTTGNPNLDFEYGSPTLGDLPIAGDWDGSGNMTIGVTRPICTATSCPGGWRWLLRNSNTAGNPNLDFEYGSWLQGDIPVAGVWIP